MSWSAPSNYLHTFTLAESAHTPCPTATLLYTASCRYCNPAASVYQNSADKIMNCSNCKTVQVAMYIPEQLRRQTICGMRSH